MKVVRTTGIRSHTEMNKDNLSNIDRMTEVEKLDAGLEYDFWDEELDARKGD